MKFSLVSVLCMGMLSAVSISACSFTQGADEERAPEHESRVVLIRNSAHAQVESVSVNRVPVSVFANALSLPAGENEIVLRYRIEVGAGCEAIDDLCATTTLRGECSGTVRTLPGRAYLLSLESRFGEVSAQMNAKGLFELLSRRDEPNVGTLTCNVPLRNDALRRRL